MAWTSRPPLCRRSALTVGGAAGGDNGFSTRPHDDDPRAARRSVVSTAGPSTHDRDGVGDRAAGVERAGRGEQRVDEEAVQVLDHRVAGHEREPGVTGHRDAEHERPRREVEQQPEGVRREHAVRRQHRDLGPAGDPARQQPGAHPDPGRAEHLERQPRADAAGQQRRGEQRRAAEHEAEAGAEDPPGQDQQEEHQLHARRCRARGRAGRR